MGRRRFGRRALVSMERRRLGRRLEVSLLLARTELEVHDP